MRFSEARVLYADWRSLSVYADLADHRSERIGGTSMGRESHLADRPTSTK